MKEAVPRKQKIKFKPASTKGSDKAWVIKTVLITFTMSAVFNVLSSGVMSAVNIWAAILILLFIILLGIVFDIVGVAVTTASEAPFHSMAAKRVKGAKRAIQLIKAKDKVSNFCNDVIGDICGIISGSAAAAVVTYILKIFPLLSGFFLSLVITASVAALTVGGKAVGKSIAIRHNSTIVYISARILSALSLKRE